MKHKETHKERTKHSERGEKKHMAPPKPAKPKMAKKGKK